MESLYSSENISLSCQVISQMVELRCPDSQVEKYLSFLQHACCGLPKDKFSKIYGVSLSPNECLESFFKVKGFKENLRANPDSCLKIVHLILDFSKITKRFGDLLEDILPWLLLSQPTSITKPLVDKALQHKDLIQLPLAVIECIIEQEPEYIEILLINFIKQLSSEECSSDLWIHDNYKHWVLWSSQSSKLFSTFTSILNALLCELKKKQVVLKAVQTYVHNVRETCIAKGRDIVALYPMDYHSLVILLQLEPHILLNSGSPLTMDYVTDKVEYFSRTNPASVLALLTHFPKWLPYIKKKS